MGFLSPFMVTALLLGAVMDGSAMVNAFIFGVGGGEHVLHCSEFPFLVRLVMTKNSISKMCGGAIISDRRILTAAHCVDGYTPSQVTAYLGDYDIRVREPHEEVKQIGAIKTHHNYAPRSPDSDIAVLTLSSPIQFGRNRCIQKINMASSFNYDRQYCWVVGWRQLHEHNPVPPYTPMKVHLPVYKMDTCKNVFPFLRPQNNMNDRVLCIGDGTADKDTCDWISGSPIACENVWRRWELVGTVSSGKLCARPGWPSFSTNVAAFNDWISQ